MELTELKSYLRIDHDLDDELLKILESTAEKFILGSIEDSVWSDCFDSSAEGVRS